MAQKPGSSTSRGPKGSALAIGSWALYDFANTIFSATCVTLWFPIYLESISGRVIDIGRANVLSMIAAGILLPVAGAVIDRTGRAKPWLFWLTVICCAATALLGAIGPPRDASHGQIRMYVFYLMTMFVVANFAYQVSLVFYNSLLTAVAPKRSVGFVSGLGVDAYVRALPESVLREYPLVTCALVGVVPVAAVAGLARVLEKWNIAIRP